ncbi:MAG TPA: divalent-cation tolerance protein CutA [Kofleriaceae bacterium]|nr:divalent-cation tolerance protein CutA [Kofleriaceae bacterium]
MPVVVVFSTFPTPEKATEVVRTLVSEQLAACGNLVGSVRSIYRWKGEVLDEPETLAILKTTQDRFEAMRARLVELHPYELPEVIAMPVEAGHAPYLAWVAAETSSSS